MARIRLRGHRARGLTASRYETLMVGWPLIASSAAGYNCETDDFGSREEMRVAWFQHRERLIEEYRRVRPGAMTWAWHEFEGPEDQRTWGLYGTSDTTRA